MTLLDEFFEEFQNSVRTIAAADGLFTRHAFVQEMATRLSDAEVIDSLIPCDFDGIGARSKKLALHGYDFGDEERQVVLAVADFRDGIRIETLSTAEAKRSIAQLEAFSQYALDGSLLSAAEESSAAYQVAAQIYQVRQSLEKIRLYLLTNARLGERVRQFESTQLGNCAIEYHLWDIDRTHRIQLSKTGREPIDIEVTQMSQGGIPALRVPSQDGLETYMAVVPGAVLATIYDKFGSRILEANVRSFLSTRGKVNSAIKGTLLQNPKQFLALNNGISATATSVGVQGQGAEVAITSIRDLQIVNGGQTTASLFYARRNDRVDLTGVFVAMKLIVVDPDQAGELVPMISRSANTQNKVSEADFFSNHPYHQRLEEKSRRLLTPSKPGVHLQTKWFYERTRGQYLNEKARASSSQAKRFEAEYPKAQVITKTEAAKYLVSWDQKPHIVSAGAQKNFLAFAESISSEWQRDDLQFGDRYFQNLVCKGILFNTVRGRVARAEWYSSGYLANIVTYTISRFSFALDQKYGIGRFDFAPIWQEQAIPEGLLLELDAIALLVFGALTAEDRPVVNVTEWAKRKECWEIVKGLPIRIGPAAEAYLLEATAAIKTAREERLQQHMDSGIAAQVRVMELGSPYWLRLRDFAKAMKMLTEKEAGILRTATGEAGRLPSEKQAAVLMELSKRMEALGFEGN